MASQDSENRMGDGEVVSAPRARQAYPGRRILWILSISLVLVVGALFSAVALYSGPLGSINQPAADKAAARSFNTPAVETP
jgi:hypothetical protein